MKRAFIALSVAAIAPAFGQATPVAQNAPDPMSVLLRYVEGFNKGDAEGLAKDVYLSADEAALEARFQELRADSFGKLDVYDVKLCPVAGDSAMGDKAKALMTYARIYTFGGKMDDDEAKLFDLVKTPDGWRIASEADARFDTALSC